MPTSMDLNTGSGGSDSPNPTDNDNNVDDDDDDDNGEMIPAKASVLKEVDEEDMDDEVIEHAVTNDAQSSLFWSTWFDSEEQEVKEIERESKKD